jgi:hypothetical protein
MRVLAFLLAALVVTVAFADRGTVRAADDCTPHAGDVSFRAADGTRLVGHRFGHGKTAVVLAHQSDGTLCQWVPYAKRLAGVVSVSGSADLADALAAAKRLRVQSLFIAAKGDRDFAPHVARFTAATPAPKHGVVLPGYQHGVALVASSARARSLIEGFLRSR